MASYHINITAPTKSEGSALEHAQYIQREGRFTAERYGEVAARGQANFPEWARQDTSAFWKASDEFERANGSVYREYEMALPRELSREQQIALVQRFAEQELGTTRAYQWAIHTPMARDGKEQPHVHLMFSDRQLDGIERGPEQFFKRYNSKNPERGGSRKATYGANKEEAALVYEGIRERWATIQNQALEHAGVEARVDHRSLAAQGIRDREPGVHRGPAVSGIEARGEVSAVGERQREQVRERAQEREAAVAEVRLVTREEMTLERVAVRERRELAKEAMGDDREAVLKRIEADRREQIGRAQAAAERRVERRRGLSIGGKLREKLLTQARALRERIGEQLGRVKEWVRERFPDPFQRLREHTREALGVRGRGRSTPQKEATLGAGSDAQAEKSRAAARSREAEPTVAPAARQSMPRRDEATREHERLGAMNSRELWAEIQKVRPSAVDRLVELDPSVAGARGTVERHQREAAQALQAANRAAAQGYAWRQAHGVQAALHDRGMKTAAYLVEREAAAAEAQRVRAEALKAAGIAQAELTLARAEATPRITQETAPARAKVLELRELALAADQREQVATAFERLARNAARSMNRDMSQEWQATPKELRDAIERYNRERPEVQKGILNAIASRPEVAQKLEKAIEVRRAQEHDQDYGLGL